MTVGQLRPGVRFRTAFAIARVVRIGSGAAVVEVENGRRERVFRAGVEGAQREVRFTARPKPTTWSLDTEVAEVLS